MKFSKDGYKRNSKDRNNPYNVIPSGNITMEGVDFPVMGTDNLGNSQIMMPGANYTFPGNSVFEVPLQNFPIHFQEGLKPKSREGSTYLRDKRSVIEDPLNVTNNLSNVPLYEGQDPSTHYMADDDNLTAWPTLFQDPSGNWYRGGREEAERLGEIYTFNTREEMIAFAREGNWKPKMQNGGDLPLAQGGGGFMDQAKAMYDDAMIKYKQYEKEGYKLPSHDNFFLNLLTEGYTVKGGFNGNEFQVLNNNGEIDPFRTNLINLYEDVSETKRNVKNKIKDVFPSIFKYGGALPQAQFGVPEWFEKNLNPYNYYRTGDSNPIASFLKGEFEQYPTVKGSSLNEAFAYAQKNHKDQPFFLWNDKRYKNDLKGETRHTDTENILNRIKDSKELDKLGEDLGIDVKNNFITLWEDLNQPNMTISNDDREWSFGSYAWTDIADKNRDHVNSLSDPGGGSLYIKEKDYNDKELLNALLNELTHVYQQNQMGRWDYNKQYVKELIGAKGDQKSLYSMPGSLEYLAHNDILWELEDKIYGESVSRIAHEKGESYDKRREHEHKRGVELRTAQIGFEVLQDARNREQAGLPPKYTEEETNAFIDFFKGVGSGALDVLSIPSNLMAEVVEGVGNYGDAEFNFTDAMPGFSGDFSFTNMYGEPTKSVSGTVGIENPWGGFAVDLLTDPTTYVGAGIFKNIVKKGITKAPSISKNVIKHGDGIVTAARKSLSFDDIMKLPDDEFIKISGTGKDYWKLVSDKKPIYKQRLIDTYDNMWQPSDKILDMVSSTKKELGTFYKSADYKKRLMDGMKISSKEADEIIDDLIKEMDNATVRFNNSKLPMNGIGMASSGSPSGSVTFTDKMLKMSDDQMADLIRHEYGHVGLYGGARGPAGKLIKNLETPSIQSSTRKVWNESDRGKQLLNYHNTPDEIRQRALNALAYMQKHNMSVDDFMNIHYDVVVNKVRSGKMSQDLLDLRQFFDPADMKDYLNKAFTITAPLGIGASVYEGEEAELGNYRYGGSLFKAQEGNGENKDNAFTINEAGAIDTYGMDYDLDEMYDFIIQNYTKVDTSKEQQYLLNKLESQPFRDRYAKQIYNITGEELSENELTERINAQYNFSAAGPDFHVKFPYVSKGPFKPNEYSSDPRGTQKFYRGTAMINPYKSKESFSEDLGYGLPVGLEKNMDYSGIYMQRDVYNSRTRFDRDTNEWVSDYNPGIPELAQYPYSVQLSDTYKSGWSSNITGDNVFASEDVDDTINHEYAHSYNTEKSPLFKPIAGQYEDPEGFFRAGPAKTYKTWLTNLFGEEYFDKKKNEWGEWSMQPQEISSIKAENEAALFNLGIWDNTKEKFGEKHLNIMLKNSPDLPGGASNMQLNALGYGDLRSSNYDLKDLNKEYKDELYKYERRSDNILRYIEDQTTPYENRYGEYEDAFISQDTFNNIFNQSQEGLKKRQKYSTYDELLEDYNGKNKRKKERATGILNSIYGSLKTELDNFYQPKIDEQKRIIEEKKNEVLPKMEMYFNEIAMDDQEGQNVMARYGGSFMNGGSLPLYQSQGEIPMTLLNQVTVTGKQPGVWPWMKRAGRNLWSGVKQTGSHALDVLSVPGNLMAEIGEGVFGAGDGSFNFSDAMPGFSGDYSFTNMHGDPTKSVSSIANIENPWGAFAVDLLTDPTSYLGAGVIKNVAKKGVSKITSKGAKNFLVGNKTNVGKPILYNKNGKIVQGNMQLVEPSGLNQLFGIQNSTTFARTGTNPLKTSRSTFTEYPIVARLDDPTGKNAFSLSRLRDPNGFDYYSYDIMAFDSPLTAGRTMKLSEKLIPKYSILKQSPSGTLSEDSYGIMLKQLGNKNKFIDVTQPGEFSRLNRLGINNTVVNKNVGREDLLRRANLYTGEEVDLIRKKYNNIFTDYKNKGLLNTDFNLKITKPDFMKMSVMSGNKPWRSRLIDFDKNNPLYQIEVPNIGIQKLYELGGSIESILPKFQYKGEIKFDELEKGIRHVESLNGELMINPESSATGLYGQLWSEVKDMYDGTREDFAKDLDYQKELFSKRANGEIEDIPGLLISGEEVFDEYKEVDHKLSMLEIAALTNFLGRQGTREYIGYHIRDGRSLESVFPKLYGEDAEYTNKTPNEYLELFRKGVLAEKKAGGEIAKKMRRIKEQLDKYNAGQELSDVALMSLKKRGLIEPVIMREGGSTTVKPGDVLGRIAVDNGLTLKELLDLNPQFKGREGSIYPGEQVFFDEESKNISESNNPILKHEVKAGDTLFKIANKYRVDIQEVAKLNNLKGDEINKIYPGNLLILPPHAQYEKNKNTEDQEKRAVSPITDNDDIVVNGKHPVNQNWVVREKETYIPEEGDPLYDPNNPGKKQTRYVSTSGKKNNIRAINKDDDFRTIVDGMNDAYSGTFTSETYTVKEGDNLSTLADKFNTSVHQLLKDNNIDKKNKNKILVGQKLKVTKSDAKPYLVIDEKKGKMHLIYPGEHIPMESYDILTGSATGDQATVTKGDYFYKGKKLTQQQLNDALTDNGVKNIRELLEVPGYTSNIDWNGGNRQTGAGVYSISAQNPDGGRSYRADSGGASVPSFNLVNDAGIEQATAIHGVTYPRKHNLYNPQYNESGQTTNTKLTTGCINGKCTDLQALYDNPDVGEGTQVFILSEDEGNGFVYENGKINYYGGRQNIIDAEESFERMDRKGNVLETVDGGPGINVTQMSNVGNYKPIQFEFDKEAYGKSDQADGSARNLTKEYNENTKPFLNSLSKNKKELMDLLQIDGDLYNDIALTAFGIYGNESGMGDINTGAEDILHQGRKWFMRDIVGSDTSYGSGSVEGKYEVASEPSQSVGWTQLRVGYGFTDPAERELLAKADEKFGTNFAIPLNSTNGGFDNVTTHQYYDLLSEEDKKKANDNDNKGGIYVPMDANGQRMKTKNGKVMPAQYHIYKIDNEQLMDQEASAIATAIILTNRYRSQIPREQRTSKDFDIFNELPKVWRPTGGAQQRQNYVNLVNQNMQYVTLTESDINEFDENTITKGDYYTNSANEYNNNMNSYDQWNVDKNVMGISTPYKSGGEFGLKNQIQFYEDYVNGLYENTKQQKSANKLYDKLNRMYYNEYKGTKSNALDIMNLMNTQTNN